VTSTIMPQRTKEERRRMAFAYKGNALLFDSVLKPAGFGLLQHRNRVAEKFRESNRRRYSDESQAMGDPRDIQRRSLA
jgi:hypothetical protein